MKLTATSYIPYYHLGKGDKFRGIGRGNGNATAQTGSRDSRGEMAVSCAKESVVTHHIRNEEVSIDIEGVEIPLKPWPCGFGHSSPALPSISTGKVEFTPSGALLISIVPSYFSRSQ